MSKLYIIGDIDWDSYKEFTQQLAVLEGKNKTIYVELASDGGLAYAALAFASRIRLSTSKIHIHASGNVASAAVLILAAGHYRTMAKEAWVMLHEDLGEYEPMKGEVTSLEAQLKKQQVEIKQLRRLEDQWDVLLETYTGSSKETWHKFHQNTTYLTADDCQFHGLIDKII